jgi:hypothetical protein
MPGLELYENKVRGDAELPIQLSVDRADKSCEVFSGHWHEQLELHYIVREAVALFVMALQRS